jgi:hypothetical protein
MAFVRPRLTDYHHVSLRQAQADFAIPFLDEDIPLYLDPFLLWRSPSLQDQALHTSLINSFNHLGWLVKQGRRHEAVQLLINLSECDEVGLGVSRTREGHRIGAGTAGDILDLFHDIPDYYKCGFVHFEEVQFFVEHISRDRISDFACSFLKSFLVDYTMQQSETHGIPTEAARLPVYSYSEHAVRLECVHLPVHPESGKPLLFVPKRWLRAKLWINFEEYFAKAYPRAAKEQAEPAAAERVKLLTYNRKNYGAVLEYVASKERAAGDCRNDPLFAQIPVASAKASLAVIRKLRMSATGSEREDQKYEREVARLLSSAFYPELDFAAEQSRTQSGGLVRDLVFYNNRAHPFLDELVTKYDCRQMVMEMKNVREVKRDHILQLNRYLSDAFGRFGVLLTRRPLPASAFRNTLDLWSGQRRCIVALTDEDLELIVDLFESRQRTPVDVLQKKYVEFMRACPG